MFKLTFEHLDENNAEENVAHAIENDYSNHAEFDEGCLEEGEHLARYEITVTVKEITNR